jgi:hypothetical protein
MNRLLSIGEASETLRVSITMLRQGCTRDYHRVFVATLWFTIWQETKYKTNAAVGGVAILIQGLKPLAFSSLYGKQNGG